MSSPEIDIFLSGYEEGIFSRAQLLRGLVKKLLPGILEQLDVPARMIAYSYGQSYKEMVCTIIPSKKGLKLGFYKGVDLPDPHLLLKGSGKISRHAEIKSKEDIYSKELKELILNGLTAYRKRMGIIN